MTLSQPHHPTLISIAPRFPVQEMEQALAFSAQQGFVTPYHDGKCALSNEMESASTSMCPKDTVC